MNSEQKKEIREYTINVFSENHIGLLNRLTIIFTRRKINIESLTVSESHIPGIHCFTIVINSYEDLVRKVALQIEKLVDVLKAFYYTTDQIIYQEIALYKLPTGEVTGSIGLETLIRDYGARVLEVTPEYTVIEKTGHKTETQELLEKLKKHKLLEFIRSGRVAITKPMKELTVHLEEKEMAFNYILKEDESY
ncbi:MAG TPA: acetolactate synthase small subunit [Bacteroidetes bacterium]|nr:acetolactate synthase small subunit [Bacteroidota bacterium]